MTADEMSALARDWIDAWNRRDVEAVLNHFDEGVRFTSPRALATTGSAVLVGKPALRAYWNEALAQIQSIRFMLDHTLWDERRQELAIVYVGELDGQAFRACEFMRFDAEGLAADGEAMYGAPL